MDNIQSQTNSKNGCLKVMVILVIGWIFSIITTLMLAGTVHLLWAWFVYPFFLWAPPFMLIVGSLLIFSIFNFKINLTKKNYKTEVEDMFIILFATILFCLISVSIGGLFSLFI